jgi:hypothetical protein
MKGQYELAELRLGRHYLLLSFIRHFPMINDIVYYLKQLLFRVFDVHDFLEFIFRLSFEFFGLLGKELLVS